MPSVLTPRRVSLAALSLPLLLLAGWALSGPAHAQFAAYTTTNVNQRAGPGTDFPVIDTVPARSQIEVFGCLDPITWCDMAYGNTRGWMAARYIQAYHQGAYSPLPEVAGNIRIATRNFNINLYWDAHYRDRPFYGDIGRWTTRGRGSVDVGVFYNRLAPHGRWVVINGRRVWVPTDVDRDWRPYTHGRWVYTRNHGWMWVSNEPFGWATYHYGRWGYSNRIGWFWVPGRRWGPAWVAWRGSGDHLAWAPLPPDREPGFSFEVSFGTIPNYYWQVAPTSAFLSIDLSVQIVRDDDRRGQILAQSEALGATQESENDEVVNTAVDVELVEEQTNEEVVPLEVVATQDQEGEDSVKGDTVEVFVPEGDEETPDEPPEVATVEEVAAESQTTGQAGDEPETVDLVVEEEPEPVVSEETPPAADEQEQEPPPPPPAEGEEAPPPAEADEPPATDGQQECLEGLVLQADGSCAPPPAAEDEPPPPPPPAEEETAPTPATEEEEPPPPPPPAEEEAPPPPPAEEEEPPPPPPPAEEEAPPPPPAEEPPPPPPAAEEEEPPPPPPPCPEDLVLQEDGTCAPPPEQ